MISARKPTGDSDSGLRMLRCALCALQWNVNRIHCPSCFEEDPYKLPQFRSDVHANVCIEACDTCRRYLKSLDLGHLIAPGDWGYRSAAERREWLKDHALPNIDYCDVHIYPRDDHDSVIDSPKALNEFIEGHRSRRFVTPQTVATLEAEVYDFLRRTRGERTGSVT